MKTAQFRKKRTCNISRKDLERQLRDQQYKCACSGIELTPALASLDHVDPRSLGGADDAANLQIVLACINKAKGTMSQDQFVAMCHAVARHIGDTEDQTWITYTGHPTAG